MLFCTCVGRFWPQNNKHIHTEGIKLGIIKTEYLILQGKNWRKQSKWLYCKIPFMRDIWIISERQSPIYLSQYLTNLMQKKICFKISFISCLYMFRAYVLIIRRSKLHYTAFGNMHETVTYRCDDTKGCVCNFDLMMMSTCARNM